MRPTVKIARLRKSALPLPAYQSEHAAGIDLMADIDAPIEMAPRERRALSRQTDEARSRGPSASVGMTERSDYSCFVLLN